MTRSRLITGTAFLLYAAGVLAITVIPSPRPRHFWDPPWQMFIHWIPFDVDPVSMVLNVVMFVPFGVLAPMLWRWAAPAWRTAWLSLGVSLAIELTQLLFLLVLNAPRTVDINDLIANTAGGLLGLWLLRRATTGRPARVP